MAGSVAGLRAWRLSDTRYATRAFTGDGPRLVGGRWNPVGVPVVYASLHLSLAVLEVFVHMDPTLPPREYSYLSVELGVEESTCERVQVKELPRNWKDISHPALARIGAEWARSMRSLVLLVPSAIVEEEWNAILNPLHPDAGKMKVGKAKAFRFDQRMFHR